MFIGGSFRRVKRAGNETDHSPPPSAEVKTAWSYNSTPPYVFIAWYLVEHRGNFPLLHISYRTLSETWSCFWHIIYLKILLLSIGWTGNLREENYLLVHSSMNSWAWLYRQALHQA